MGMHRRAFLQGAAIVAATPLVANLISLTTTPQSITNEALHKASAEEFVTPVEFKIRGWQENDYLVPARETIPLTGRTNGNPIRDQVLIVVNQGWRSAWR